MQATELYDILNRLADEQPSAEGLRRMHEVLVLCCAEGVRDRGGTFGNLFSQVDFVCREHGLSAADTVAVQVMRRHSNQNVPPAEDDWRYDLRALSRLVSAVFAEAVPDPLLRRLPPHNRPIAREHHDKRPYTRCIVRSLSDTHFTADADGEPISVPFVAPDGSRDFSYLRKVLRPGMQVNLLDCDPMPTLIVVEPDFLVDISSVAACFTAYGHHPLLYTVNRLKPRPNSQAVLLGNFAGTALDEAVRAAQGEGGDLSRVMQSSLRRSFREQALRFCACDDFDAARFKRDAAQQVTNIIEAISALSHHPTPNPHHPTPTPQHPSPTTHHPTFLLEPSFVCERLGLQGRVDLMTADMRLLVEQKAGRNAKIERQSHDAHGRQQEAHYVQLLLYYGVLRYNFGLTDHAVDTRLLYSRYPIGEGLLAVNFYRTLFREALQLRNQIVATELLIAREGFGRIVPLLSPAFIYKEVKPDAFFSRYVAPELARMADQLARLSPLERAYYERMMTFVYREQLYQKLGSAQTRLQHSSGSASDLWQLSLTEKLATGCIVQNLAVVGREKSDAEGGFDLITLQARDKEGVGEVSFRRGDMVSLYSYRRQPDARAAILYKGTLEAISTDGLTVRLNDGQQNDRIFALNSPDLWAVEPASSDLSTSASLRAIHQFVTGDARRRALLLGQRAPEAHADRRLSRSYTPVYDDVLRGVAQSADYYLLVGPPGTGKTSQALRHIIAEDLLSPDAQLLLTAYTNRAVDEICAMLESEGHDYLRLGNASSCDRRFQHRLLEQALAALPGLEAVREHIARARIIVGTTSTLQARQEILRLKHFARCIVDEASQILEPSLIGLLSHPAIDRFVLIGDYKQLPAVVQQGRADAEVAEPCLQAIGLSDCRQSLFERLIRWEERQGRTQFVGLLDHQGRMHPEVADFPCRHFYARERLQPVPLAHQREQGPLWNLPPADALDALLLDRRVLFLPVGGGKAAHDEPQELLHEEARLVADVLVRVSRFAGETFDTQKTVGVIVPYRSQIALIRQQLELTGREELLEVSIDTVERYQGSQRDVIVYSLAVSHRYQLDFLTANTFEEDGRQIDRKLNVAMTRARRQLVVTGREDVLRGAPLFGELIDEYGAELIL